MYRFIVLGYIISTQNLLYYRTEREYIIRIITYSLRPKKKLNLVLGGMFSNITNLNIENIKFNTRLIFFGFFGTIESIRSPSQFLTEYIGYDISLRLQHATCDVEAQHIIQLIM